MLKEGIYIQDRYEIIGKIGSGGMADVYKAKDHKLNRFVAIKVMKPEFRDDKAFITKFRTEAQSAGGLEHPNIVNVYDVGEDHGVYFIVMELVEGITLKDYIEKKRRLSAREATSIAIQVSMGLEAAHNKNIVHRDIKPQNIIISTDGKVKVTDFGIARAASSQTMSATAVGSVHYISPEQARGGYCDTRSDIYSFGVTLYEMMTGKVPFEGDNTVTVALAHLEEPMERPSAVNPSVPVSLEKIILKCTQKKPEYRYGSMGEVIEDLRRALIEPDADFVEEAPRADSTARTVTISEEELNKIRQGSKKRRQAESGGQRIGRQMDPEEIEEPATVEQQISDQEESRPERQEDVSPQLERLLTGLGIFVAVLFVAGVLLVLVRVSGIFNLGSGAERTQEAVTAEEETDEDGDTVVPMPDVMGLTMDQAEERLGESDLIPEWEEVMDEAQKGTVIDQEPQAGETVERYSKVKITASSGSDQLDLAALGILEMTEEEAKDFFAQNRITASFQRQYSDTVELGKVISCDPMTVKAGDAVTVLISDGPEQEMTVMPDLLNRTEEEALALLAEAGLNPGRVTYDNSSTVPKDSVMGQEVPRGTAIMRGSEVGYTVSGGPASGDGQRYVGAISTTFDPSSLIGPGSGSVELRILIRLMQVVDGEPAYTPLMPATTVNGSTLIPINFSNIEGADGVDTGEVQVVNADTQEVLRSYTIQFFPLG